ncbi:MAG: hypothetical protein ACOZAN_00905 [Patescibacteria group bacterium]
MKNQVIYLTSVGTDPRLLRQHYALTRAMLLGRKNQQLPNITHNNTWQNLQKSSSSLFSVVLNLVLAIALLAGIVWWAPKLYYTFFSDQAAKVTAQTVFGQLEQSITDRSLVDRNSTGGNGEASGSGAISIDSVEHSSNSHQETYLPPIDVSLPEGEWIVIPKIGVYSQLRSTQDPDEALEQGIWMAPDYGKPGDRELPMIVAGHRFGWDWWWQSDFGKKNSFNMLPSLVEGDQVEIISGQRKWVYEIYAGEEGQEITDYSADAIFYTCKHLNSPIRYFRYAKLLDPSLGGVSSQSNVESAKEAGESGLIAQEV